MKDLDLTSSLTSGGDKMAYPDPVPELSAKEAQLFEQKLQKFELTAAQKEFYAEARKLFPAPKED